MNKEFSPSPIPDYVGVAALTGAAAALAGIMWAVPIATESTLFAIFHWSLAIGLGAFLGNRIFDIARIVALTPNPKSLRSRASIEAADLEIAETGNVTSGKFRKAA